MRTRITNALLVIACTVSAYLFWELREARHAAVPVVNEARNGNELASDPPSQSDAVKSPQIVEIFSADQSVAGNARLELLKDPEYRKTRIAQIRANLVQRYPGLAQVLGSEYDAERLLDRLAEQQLNTNAALNALRAQGVSGDVAREERTRILEEGRRERDRLLVDSLGDSGFDQWQTYEDSLPLRADADRMLSSGLSASAQSMSSAQRESMVTVAAMEQSRYEKEMQLLLQRGRENGVHALSNVQNELLTLREASNRRILDAARPYLGPDQLAALSKSFEQEASAARANLRAHQERAQH